MFASDTHPAARLSQDCPEAPHRVCLDLGVKFPVNANQLLPERGERRAAAAASALSGHGNSLEEAAVEAIQQLPGAAVAHVQVACGLRQRTALPDVLEQRDLARSHGRGAPE